MLTYHRFYRRFVADDYGHLDTLMGQTAAEDVWWRIEAHLDEVIQLRKEHQEYSMTHDALSESTSSPGSVI
jgi:hypothetical protein